MPSGYLVVLGDGKLDVGDAIVDPLVTFTTDTIIDATAEWIWSGTWNGTTFTNEVEPGQFILGTDGNVYFVPDFGAVDTITSASVQASDPYDTAIFGTAGDDASILGTIDDDLIYGGADRTLTGTGNDTILAGEGADTVYGGDGADSISGQGGDDTLFGGDGDDTLLGGLGADSLSGDDGNDSLDGGGQTPVASTSEVLDWSLAGADESDISGGFVQNTGTMDVTFTYVNDGNGTEATVESTTLQYVATGETFDPNSSLQLGGSGQGDTSTTTLDFSANTAGLTDSVQNVSFRINDIDTGGWQDFITISAFDAAGNPVTVTLTPNGDDTISGNTITAGPGGDSASSATGSILVTIAGPVSQIVIDYDNLNTAGQLIFISDVHFDTVPQADGADTLIGGAGNDTLILGSQDIGEGGDGDDLFLIDASALNGGTITVTGGEGAETTGDVLDLSGVLDKGSLVITNPDDNAGGLSGTATLIDGTVVTFSEIETIICFTTGTMIRTPYGDRAVGSLRPGDLVLTLDHGPQPVRWIAQKTVPAAGDLAPIRIRRGVLDAQEDLLVSPQHRMLVRGWAAQLHFAESEVLAPAKSLLTQDGIEREEGGYVTYVHILFDRHEIVFANGTASESFHPGRFGVAGLADPAREELFKLFPDLRVDPAAFGPSSRTCVRHRDALALALA